MNMELVELFFASIINAVFVLYLLRKILNENAKIKKINYFLAIIIYAIFTFINYLVTDNYLRFVTSTIIIATISYFLFKNFRKKIIVAAIMEQIIMFLSELIFMFILLIVFNLNKNFLLIEIRGAILTTFIICSISFVLINIKFVKNTVDKILNYIVRINKLSKYIMILILIVTLNVLLIMTYLNIDNMLVLVINCLFILIYSYIVFMLLNEKQKNIVFKEENETLINNLNEYEKMLDYQRVSNHENKNQLLVIKSLIDKKNNKAMEYVDEIINEKRVDDEGLFAKAKRIPAGGLQGIIYQKMLIMKEKGIEIDLDVSREVRKINFDNISTKMIYEICRIVGIVIDNAIDETLKLSKKSVSINVYNFEQELIIEVSNRFKDVPNLEKIYDKGYTTKEDGHGYGLSLLKEIVEKNKTLYNENTITKDTFTQIIKIKM